LLIKLFVNLVKYKIYNNLAKNFIYNGVYSIHCSSSLNYWFNLGSILGIALVFQIISGLLLLLNYNSLERYERIIFITIEVNYGWLIKLFHRNNARFIFLCLYLHLFKALSFNRWRLTYVWYSGLIIIIIIIGAAFSGYVLVGSQISLWAAIVITRLISVFPLNGNNLMYFVWGGYRISWITLQTLLLVHFILPFLVLLTIIFHLNFLHKTGRTSLLYSHRIVEKITFFPFFWIKDIINILVFIIFLVIILLYPYSLGEVELFEEANFLSSPAHIVPEWYFTCQYAILRRVPSKGIGVLIMFARIAILFLYPTIRNYITPASNENTPIWVVMFVLQTYLSYLGFSPIRQPFVVLSLISMYFYFLYHLFNIIIILIVEHRFSVCVNSLSIKRRIEAPKMKGTE